MAILGTAAIVADMAILGTTDVVSDMNTLGTADIVTDMNLLATSANVTNMATLGASGVVAKITTVAGISSDVTSVAADATDIGTVAGKATEIGRLGTVDAVADMAILGTADVVSDMNTLATSGIVEDLNILATSDIVTDMNLLATSANVTAMGLIGNSTTVTNMGLLGTSAVVTDIGLLGTSAVVNDLDLLATSANVTAMGLLGTSAVVTDMGILGTTAAVADMAILGTADVVADLAILGTADIVSDMNTLGTSANVTAMDTVATNIAGVNSFADRYRVASSAPTTSLDEGDLYFNTTDNNMYRYNGTSWAEIVTYTAGTGVSISGSNVISASAIALTTVQTAASQSAHLSLTAQEGDVVVRSDENKTYVKNSGSAGTMADFTLLQTPTDAVTSVDGATGVVTLNHDSLTGFVANEHIDWTADQGSTNIDTGNYTNTVYTHPNHSGDVTSSGDGTTTIGNDKVTYAKIQNVSATDRILGRDTAGAGDVEEITPANLRTMINVADGANNYTHPNHSGDVVSTADGATTIQSGAVDIAMLSATGVGSTKFLRGDNTWVVPTDTDTVFTLPTASASTLGGVKVGTNLSIASGVLSSTDTNTTYLGGTGITLTGTTFATDYGTTSGTAAEGNHTHSGYETEGTAVAMAIALG